MHVAICAMASPSPDSTVPTPRSVSELTARNVSTIIELEEAERAKRTATDRVADVVTRFCGTTSFLWLHVLWFGGWIVLNVMPGIRHFDPFPFPFLTLAVSLEAIFLSTFILISENRQSRLAERRNHLDLQINLLAEQENTTMLRLLERIADRVGARKTNEQEARVLGQQTEPEELAEQIERAIDKSERSSGTGGIA
jgi:uncharacterized membrane protein